MGRDESVKLAAEAPALLEDNANVSVAICAVCGSRRRPVGRAGCCVLEVLCELCAQN